MQHGLTRCHLGSVAPVTERNTLKILPLGKSRRQKVVVGDGGGNVTCMQIQKGENQVVFAKQVGEAKASTVRALVLDQRGSGESFYVASGKSILGFNRKGKQVSKLDTNLSGHIKNGAVLGDRVFVAEDLAYASYQSGKEVEYLSFPEVITAMAVDACKESFVTFLGTKDNRIHAMLGGRIHASFVAPGAVACLSIYPSTMYNVVYGTSGGTIGMVHFSEDKQFVKLWEIRYGVESGTGCSVSAIALHDLTKDGVPEMVVGRENGLVEVYKVNQSHELAQGHRPLFKDCVDECVQAVQVGTVSSPGFDEIVVCTYSGQLIGFTTERVGENEGPGKSGKSKAVRHLESRVEAMETQLASVERQLASAKAKLNSKSKGTKSTHRSLANVHVNSQLTFLPSEARYLLSIEMPLSIDMLILQSKLAMMVFGFNSSHSQDNVVMSTALDKFLREPSPIQAVFRCTVPTRKLTLNLRPVEGHHGNLNITIVPAAEHSVAKQVRIPVKPLSLHHRLYSLSDDRKVGMSSLEFTGSFSLNQAHDWVSYCLPEAPSGVPTPEPLETKDDCKWVELNFEHCLTRSVLLVQYREGSIRFLSNSVSSLSIVREVVSKLANNRKVSVDIHFQIKPESVTGFLRLVDGTLCVHSQRAKEAAMVEALREVTNDASEKAFLTKRYKDLLETETTPEKNLMFHETLCGILYDAYVDYQKFRGVDAGSAQTHALLMEILNNYDLDRLIQFFTQ